MQRTRVGLVGVLVGWTAAMALDARGGLGLRPAGRERRARDARRRALAGRVRRDRFVDVSGVIDREKPARGRPCIGHSGSRRRLEPSATYRVIDDRLGRAPKRR